MTTWGSGEARELGIYDLLAKGCGREVPFWDNYVGPMLVMHREMTATTPQGLLTLTFYHPEMQEALLAAAASAGAEVRRGIRAQNITPGKRPTVSTDNSIGKREELEARLVVAADGRGSMARKWGGFSEQQDPERLLISGLVFDGVSAPQDTVRLVNDLAHGHAAILFPQGSSRARSYFICNASEGLRLQGDKDVPRFIERVVACGMPHEFFEGATAVGPLATFDAVDCYVEHPYRDGVALIGDAAASADPSWGQGLSLTVRDARALRDALAANDDWDAAGHAYATEHDSGFNLIHTIEDWLTQFFFEKGAEADARRQRAFPLIAQDPTRVPDALFSGPNASVPDEATKRRFFGED
jgi:menaquinone-9 beta-reductase